MKQVEPNLAEALTQAHGALLKDLRKLETLAAADGQDSPTRLIVGLNATRADITRHFRFEEENGYMDTVRKREPRLERTVQQLAEEHRQLTQSLDELIREASEDKGSAANALRARVRAWIKRVRQHEAREAELVQDAFNFDIGAED